MIGKIILLSVVSISLIAMLIASIYSYIKTIKILGIEKSDILILGLIVMSIVGLVLAVLKI
jgi:hypothetical protein